MFLIIRFIFTSAFFLHNIFSNCTVAIQWLACMQFIAIQAGHWISNPFPNKQNTDAQADAESA